VRWRGLTAGKPEPYHDDAPKHERGLRTHAIRESPRFSPRVRVGGGGRPKGKINRVGPGFGSTLTASSRDSQSDCWVSWKILGQPCGFQVINRTG
jgi:hypothetical protein